MFSDSIEEHEEHLSLVFDKLRKAQLYLEEKKLDLFSKRMDCLGHIGLGMGMGIPVVFEKG
jgi:hypothetical protein